MSQQAVTSTGPVRIGRPLSKTGKEAQRALEEFLNRLSYDQSFSTEDIRRVTMQSIVTVRNRLNSLMKAGIIEVVKTEKITENGVAVRGRPQSIYRKVPQ